MQLSVEEEDLCSGLCYYPKGKSNCFILGTGSNCSYFDGKELHQKYSHWYIIMDDCSGNVFGKERVLFQ
jgi:N-acetylglucosamine kinase-like BadF-type ATPase